MENFDKLPFSEPPASEASLVELCCRSIAKAFHSYDLATVSDLPAPMLSSLVIYLTPKDLHGMTAILKRKGVDASPAWKKHIFDVLKAVHSFRKRSLRLEDDDRQHFIVHRKACRFHQKYISLHCEILLKKLNSYLQPDAQESQEIYRSLLHFLPTVLHLKMKMKYFVRLLEWDDILSILLSNLETLILTEMEDMALKAGATVERAAKLLKTFCESGTLKGIKLEANFCQLLQALLPIASEILQALVPRTNKENRSVKETDDSDHQEDSLFDDAVTSVVSVYYQNFDETLKQIDQKLNASHEDTEKTVNRNTRNSVISLSLKNFPFRHILVYLLPHWTSLQRLELEGVSQYADPGLIRVVLQKIGCHQFTHLRLADLHIRNLVPQIIYILCEYYRRDRTLSPSMELLDLTSITNIENSHGFYDDGPTLETFSQFKSEINAVRGLCFTDITFNPLDFLAFQTLLQLNTCLTCLSLTDVSIVRTSSSSNVIHDLSWISVFQNLMENTSLKALSFGNFKLASDGNVATLRTILSEFLNEVQTLQTLKLVNCGIQEDLVNGDDFIKAVQHHSSLTCLSLSENRIGSAGAQFMASVFGTGKVVCLKELDLSSCKIPGEDLLTTAQMLDKSAIRKPIMNKLCISGMLLGNEGAGGLLHRELRHEFEQLTVCLEADYYGNHMVDHIANM